MTELNLFDEYAEVEIDMTGVKNIGRDYFHNWLFYTSDEAFAPPMPIHNEDFNHIKSSGDKLVMSVLVINGELDTLDCDAYNIGNYMSREGLSEMVVNWIALDLDDNLQLHNVYFVYEYGELEIYDEVYPVNNPVAILNRIGCQMA